MDIFIDSKTVIGTNKVGRNTYLLLSDNSTIKLSEIKEKCHYFCEKCNVIQKININYGLYVFRHNITRTCCKCNSTGENNPFYGKTHTEDIRHIIKTKATGRPSKLKGLPGPKMSDATKVKLSIANSGENNSFYGKTHSKEIIDRILESRRITNLNKTEEEKITTAKKLSDSQKKLLLDDPITYKKLKQKAAFASIESQSRYKPSSIEYIVKTELEQRGIPFIHSVIYGHYQFDFLIRNVRIMLEVHGDFWHCNPKIYNKPKYKCQEIKLEKDKIKAEYLKNKDFQLRIIWEDDIKNQNFTVLDTIQNEISTYKARNQTDGEYSNPCMCI